MRRVVVLGCGASGKSAFAVRLGEATGLPVVELDAVFWSADLSAPTPARWAEMQRDLVAAPEWILDGDLGPHDVLDVRLGVADTVVLLDLSLPRCAWRALRRSRERVDFWWWLLTYRRRRRPRVLAAVHRDAARLDHTPRPPVIARTGAGTTGMSHPHHSW